MSAYSYLQVRRLDNSTNPISGNNVPALFEIINGVQNRSGRALTQVTVITGVFGAITYVIKEFAPETFQSVNIVALGMSAVYFVISIGFFVLGMRHVSVGRYVISDEVHMVTTWNQRIQKKLRQFERLHSLGIGSMLLGCGLLILSIAVPIICLGK